MLVEDLGNTKLSDLPSEESGYNPLQKFSNEELGEMIQKSKMQSKKLALREYIISGELDQINKNIEENEEIIKQLKKTQKDPVTNTEFLVRKEIMALLYNIQYYTQKVVKCEKELLEKNISGSTSKSPFLEEFQKDFNEKGYQERYRNRELGLYVKQDFLVTKNQEITKLKENIENMKEEINQLFEKIREHESKQINYIETISALRRIKNDEEERNSDLTTKLGELKGKK